MAGFGLINMNGRLYDPYLQRFLSPDPFVKSPDNAQNYNRYTYCLNNPLAYTDPTGYNQEELIDNGFKLSDLGYDMKGGSGVIKEYLNRGGGPAAGSLGYVYNWDGTYTDKATGKTASYKIVYKYVSPYIWKDCGTYTEGKNGELVSLGGHGRIWSENPDFHRIPAKNVGNLSNEPNSAGGTDFSLAVMYLHFQFGGEKPMMINSSSLDFSGTSQSKLGLDGMKKGESREASLFKTGINGQSLAFGRLEFTYQGNNQFSITDNMFDFDYQAGQSFSRNAGTILGGAVNYNLIIGPISPLVPLIFGGPYNVIFNGNVTIPK